MDDLMHVRWGRPRLTNTRLAELRLRVQHSTKPGREEAAIVCSSLSHIARAADDLLYVA